MEEAWTQFEAWVTANGGRHTSERRLLYEVVCELPRLFDVDALVAQLAAHEEQGGMRLSRATAYNTLTAFVKAGLLVPVSTMSGKVYVRAHGRDVVLVQECTECGALQVLKATGGVGQAVAHLAFRGFTPQRSTVLVNGLCARCAKALKKREKQKTQIKNNERKS